MFKDHPLYGKLCKATMLEPVYVMITKTTEESAYVLCDFVIARSAGIARSGLSVQFDMVYDRKLDGPCPHPHVFREFAITNWTTGLVIEEISEKEFGEEKRKNEVFGKVMAELTKPGTDYLKAEDEMCALIARFPNDTRVDELEELCRNMREVALMEAGY